jgi:hypothetical protein
MFKPARRLMVGAGLIGTSALVALAPATVGAKTTGRPDSGVLYVAITHTVGSTNYLAGNAADKILGSSAVLYTAKVGTGSTPGTFKVTANPVTVFTKTGSLSGTGSATLIVNTDGTVTFTDGKLTLAKGADGQKGHRFVGTFMGSGKSATGPFVYDYKGIYR